MSGDLNLGDTTRRQGRGCPGLHGGWRCVLSDPVRLGGVFSCWLAPNTQTGHTSTMTLKNAAFLALIGTLLLTILLSADFINAVLAVVRGLIPGMALLRRSAARRVGVES